MGVARLADDFGCPRRRFPTDAPDTDGIGNDALRLAVSDLRKIEKAFGRDIEHDAVAGSVRQYILRGQQNGRVGARQPRIDTRIRIDNLIVAEAVLTG